METIISLFKHNVNNTPSNIAVITANRTITYLELDVLSNRGASYLSKIVTKGDRVGICLSQDPLDIVVSIFAILKIGCVYVPIDPKNPIERVEYLLNQSEPKVIVGDNSAPEFVKNFNKFLLINNLIDFKVSEQYPSIIFQENDPAYIIFTSGSTGMPKGVAVSHHNLVNAYFAWEKSYDLKNIRCHLQVAGYSFYVFSGDWIRSLCSGAKLVMCPEDIIRDPKAVYKLIESNKVECAEFLPALLRGLFNYLKDTNQQLTTFKILICGSDKWFVSEYFNFKKLILPTTRLINSYGTSETTIDTSYFEFNDENRFLENETIQVPIGKAFPGMKIVLFDEELKETDLGEIFIGGTGVSLGYINSSQQNDEKFLKINNESYYRTGDYGKKLSTGDIEFLGRRDNQIKFRGKRISLAEIENVFITHFPIADSAVILNEKDNVEELIAFIAAKEGDQGYLKDNLEKMLRNHLPEYMLPDKYIFLSQLPTNLNGKTDRKSLLNNFINGIYG